MAERTVELEQPVLTDETAEALRTATERAERAEAELAKLKAHPAGTASTGTASTGAASAGAASSGSASAEALKQPPSPNTAATAPEGVAGGPVERGSAEVDGQLGGEEELRKDPMMAFLLDSLEAGTDVGHYGRLVFAMVARHFLPHEEVLAWMVKDKDFSEEQASAMLHQVEGRDYSPPRRERLLEWQKEQEFQFIDASDPDSGNLYRNLKFPDAIYQHIGHYQEAKS